MIFLIAFGELFLNSIVIRWRGFHRRVGREHQEVGEATRRRTGWASDRTGGRPQGEREGKLEGRNKPQDRQGHQEAGGKEDYSNSKRNEHGEALST